MIIDRLEIAPANRQKDEMKRFEYFECDWCRSVCKMNYETYRNLFEPFIRPDTKYRCERCYQLENKRPPGRPKKEPTETVTQTQQQNNVRIESDKEEDKTVVTVRMDWKPQEPTNIIDHPPHYTAGNIECIDAIEAAIEGLPPQEAVLVANVIKYLWRYKRKNGKQDLQKAQWYLNRLVDKQP